MSNYPISYKGILEKWPALKEEGLFPEDCFFALIGFGLLKEVMDENDQPFEPPMVSIDSMKKVLIFRNEIIKSQMIDFLE